MAYLNNLSKGYEKFKEILKKNLHFASHKYANSMWFKFIKFKSQCPVAVVVDQLAKHCEHLEYQRTQQSSAIYCKLLRLKCKEKEAFNVPELKEIMVNKAAWLNSFFIRW